MGAQREPAASVRQRQAQRKGAGPRGELPSAIKKKGHRSSGRELRRSLEFEPSSESNLEE